MSSQGQKRKVESPDIPDWMKRALECPVCLEIIMDPPIYICDNPQAHSVCSTCYLSLQQEGKACPLCRKSISNRRNITLENMLDNIPNKVECRFEGCDFKRSNGEAVRKHEGECENRQVPCLWCVDKIGMKILAEHIPEKHGKACKITYPGLVVAVTRGIYFPKTCLKAQSVLTENTQGNSNNKRPQFLMNWHTLEEGGKMFWISYIGAKDSARKYKYTMQVKASENSQKYHSEGTKWCVPCDLSQEEVKRKVCAIFLDKELVEEAMRGNNDKLWLNLTIQPV